MMARSRREDHGGVRLQRLRQAQRLPASAESATARPVLQEALPPPPPIALTPAVACNPDTDGEILWHIARHVPELRRWLAANPRSDAALLEYVAQAGGPGVHQALSILLVSMEYD